VLGDSIAAGIGASDPSRRGFAAIVHGYLERLSDRPVELVNLAIPGETTTTFLDGGQFDEAQRTVAEARGAGLRVSPIVVSLGANDLLDVGEAAEEREAVIATVASNLDRIFAALRTATAETAGQATADLLAVTYYDPTGSNPERPDSDAWWVARLNATIAGAAADFGGRAPDLLALFQGREAELTWYPSDVHPTNEGHRVIAQALWAASGYDTVAPVVTLLRPAAGDLSRPMPTIAATAQDRVGVEAVEALLNGQRLGALEFQPDAGAYLLLWDAHALAPGDHRLEIRAYDAAGNAGSAVATVRPSPSQSAAIAVASPRP
jgi:lysophospholipase L1-like esterase